MAGSEISKDKGHPIPPEDEGIARIPVIPSTKHIVLSPVDGSAIHLAAMDVELKKKDVELTNSKVQQASARLKELCDKHGISMMWDMRRLPDGTYQFTPPKPKGSPE
jgi:hypothetical protein